MQTVSMRRFMLGPTAGLCLLAEVVLGAGVVTRSAAAEIGASLEQSKARISVHIAKHRARHPLFATNKRGIVVWECWEAPAGGWTKPQAMSLVRDLIPEVLKTDTPRRVKSQSGGEMLVYRDGTTVWLEFSVPKALYRLAAVWTREYRGSEC